MAEARAVNYEDWTSVREALSHCMRSWEAYKCGLCTKSIGDCMKHGAECQGCMKLLSAARLRRDNLAESESQCQILKFKLKDSQEAILKTQKDCNRTKSEEEKLKTKIDAQEKEIAMKKEAHANAMKIAEQKHLIVVNEQNRVLNTLKNQKDTLQQQHNYALNTLKNHNHTLNTLKNQQTKAKTQYKRLQDYEDNKFACQVSMLNGELLAQHPHANQVKKPRNRTHYNAERHAIHFKKPRNRTYYNAEPHANSALSSKYYSPDMKGAEALQYYPEGSDFRGRVVKFHMDRGFGFIHGTNGPFKIKFHWRALRPIKLLPKPISCRHNTHKLPLKLEPNVYVTFRMGVRMVMDRKTMCKIPSYEAVFVTLGADQPIEVLQCCRTCNFNTCEAEEAHNSYVNATGVGVSPCPAFNSPNRYCSFQQCHFRHICAICEDNEDKHPEYECRCITEEVYQTLSKDDKFCHTKVKKGRYKWETEAWKWMHGNEYD
eukprot:213127_1